MAGLGIGASQGAVSGAHAARQGEEEGRLAGASGSGHDGQLTSAQAEIDVAEHPAASCQQTEASRFDEVVGRPADLRDHRASLVLDRLDDCRHHGASRS
jgi:hypothetical protein